MSTPPDATRDGAELRRLAELRLAANAKRSRSRQKREDPRGEPERILHELQVHQVELEMQNAELLATRDRLEQMVEKYTDLYDFAPVGYLSLDRRGRILEANLTGALWFGVARGRLVQRVMGTMVALESQPVLQAWLDDVFTTPGDHTCQIQVLRPSGAPSLWLSLRASEDNCSDDRHRWCRVAASDITARRTLEERMQRTGELLGALVEQVPMGVYLVDARMVLQQANPGARLIFRGVEPLIGRPLEEILHVVWKNRVVEEIMVRFRETLATGRTYHSAAFTERRRDLGIRESYEWQIQRVTLSSGETGVVCFFSDITERKHAEVIRRRLEALTATNRKLEREIVQRHAVEESLRLSEQHQVRLVGEAFELREKSRLLARHVLVDQENERKRVSRELHDIIAQSLTGVSLTLAGLRTDTHMDVRSFKRRISLAERQVAASVEIVHRFARELRPTVLDDLGLVPALRTFIKAFIVRTRLKVTLSAYAAVEELNTDRRTVLFRVAQEALINVERHAAASRVELEIERVGGRVRMRIRDDGKSFDVKHAEASGKGKRLGLLGMVERVEMIGGSFGIESSPGQGTTVTAEIPVRKKRGVKVRK